MCLALDKASSCRHLASVGWMIADRYRPDWHFQFERGWRLLYNRRSSRINRTKSLFFPRRLSWPYS
jgi:hypothetical protein